MQSLPPSDTTPAPRPSMSARLATVATSPYTPLSALVFVAITAIGAWQANQGVQSTAKVSYETLAAARVTDSARIDGCYQGLEKLRVWNQALSDRLDRRAAATAAQLAAKLPKPSAARVPAPPVEPAPKAPPVPVVPEPTALPPFADLGNKKAP